MFGLLIVAHPTSDNVTVHHQCIFQDLRRSWESISETDDDAEEVAHPVHGDCKQR